MANSYLSSKIKLYKSKIDDKGLGLVCIKKIKKGELIIDYSTGRGRFLNSKDYDILYDRGNHNTMQVDDDLHFVATNEKETEDADFLNHSCNPNCGINGNLKIASIREIKPKEEITIDYAMAGSSDFKMKCNCKSKNCRKIITGNDWKIKDLQKRYNGFFSDYLQKKIDKINKITFNKNL